MSNNQKFNKAINEENDIDTRQKLINAASKIFFEQGYARATTREIAAEANLTEVTLFRHFGNKENLFKAAAEQFGAIPDLTKKLINLITGDYQKDMMNFGKIFMKIVYERRNIIRLLLFEANYFPQVQKSVANAPRELREMLAKYLQEQKDKKVVRDIHPRLAANTFWGMFLSYFLSQDILGESAAPDLDESEILAQMVDIFISGTKLD